jgi:hypothetical protein
LRAAEKATAEEAAAEEAAAEAAAAEKAAAEEAAAGEAERRQAIEMRREAERIRLAGIETTPDNSPFKDLGYSSLAVTLTDNQIVGARNGLQELQNRRDATAPGEVHELRREVEELTRKLADAEKAEEKAREDNAVLDRRLCRYEKELDMHRQVRGQRNEEDNKTMWDFQRAQRECWEAQEKCWKEQEATIERSRKRLKSKHLEETAKFAHLWVGEKLSTELPDGIEDDVMLRIPHNTDRLLGALYVVLVSNPHALTLIERYFRFDIQTTLTADSKSKAVTMHGHFRAFDQEIYRQICNKQRDPRNITRGQWSRHLGGIFEPGRHSNQRTDRNIWITDEDSYSKIGAANLLKLLEKHTSNVYEQFTEMAHPECNNVEKEPLIKDIVSHSRRLDFYVDNERRTQLESNAESVHEQSITDVGLLLKRAMEQEEEEGRANHWERTPTTPHLLLQTFLRMAAQDLIHLICHRNLERNTKRR